MRQNSNTSPIEITARPCCSGCHRQMAKAKSYKGVINWKCIRCGRYAASVSRQMRPTRNPCCVACKVAMRTTSTVARGLYWACDRCGAWCRKEQIGGIVRERRLSGDLLLHLINSKIDRYSVDVREELRGEIMIAILSKRRINGQRVKPSTLSSATVSAIARPILRAQPNRFRFVSLDHARTEGGYRLEERLAG